MVYKNNRPRKKSKYKKAVFYILLIIYFAGICAGCTFALKNQENMDFVAKVAFTQENFIPDKNGALSQPFRYLIRDILCIAAVFVLKNSGILKGMCLCVPFVAALQNSCIYTILIGQSNIGIFNIVFFYILKDTAAVFLILLYCYLAINEIINQKSNIHSDYKRAAAYASGIIFVYLIDYAIKVLIYPF